MPTASLSIRRSRVREKLTRLAAVMLGAAIALPMWLVATPAQAGTEFEDCLLSKTNSERSSRGLGKLKSRSEMVAYARAHTEVMVAADDLFHSSNLQNATTGWAKVAENVGRGGSCTSLFDAFMASPPHRAAILGADFTSIGVGGGTDGVRMYVTVVFAEHKEAEKPKTTTTTTDPKRTETTEKAQPDKATEAEREKERQRQEEQERRKAEKREAEKRAAEKREAEKREAEAREKAGREKAAQEEADRKAREEAVRVKRLRVVQEIKAGTCERFFQRGLGGPGCVLEEGSGGSLVGYLVDGEVLYAWVFKSGAVAM